MNRLKINKQPNGEALQLSAVLIALLVFLRKVQLSFCGGSRMPEFNRQNGFSTGWERAGGHLGVRG